MLELQNVSCVLSKVRVLTEISLSVPKGEVTVVLGLNGSGKSVLMRSIIGVTTITSGKVLLGGQEISHLPVHERVVAGVVLVPERRGLFADMTVEDNLLLGSFVSHARRQRSAFLDKVYHQFPVLVQRRRQIAKTLSGGEQQMLAVARGLVAAPKVLLLDEPFLGLSPRLCDEIIMSLGRIARDEGLAVLLAEQNADISLRHEGQAHVLQHGRIVIVKPSAQLRNDQGLWEILAGGRGK